MRPNHQRTFAVNPLTRVHIWHACLLLIAAVILVKLFYIQIIRHGYYTQAALRGQLKQYQIEPERGTILAYSGNNTTPLVLNQTLYTLYADPKYIKDPAAEALAIHKTIGGDVVEYEKKMKAKSRYQILAKKLTNEQRDAITRLKLKGVGTLASNYRTYPQGSLAAQVLGFVNDEGDGQYGIEESLNDKLKGKPGELKAITDAQGVPLAANTDNIIVNPEPGKQILLSIDLGMQQQMEEILKQQVDDTKAKIGSALIIDANSGKVKAMANYPTYNPAEFYKVKDISVFSNAAISNAFELGSVMKILTAAAALDKGVVNKNTSYFDPSKYVIDGQTVRNIEEDGGPGTKTVADVLQLSLNTGATWLLMQLGGGEINEKARQTWHDYLINRFRFSKATGIELANESAGIVPDPNEGYGLNIQYANTSFGQGQTETILQLGAATVAAVNGGTYYKPSIVEAYIDQDGHTEKQDPIIIKRDVIKASASKDLRSFMEHTVDKNKLTYGVHNLRPEYSYGGKTGTAEIPNPSGGYYNDRQNGTYVGYIGGDTPEYVIVVAMHEPKVSGYAGAKAAAPVFFKLSDMLINNFGVKPKS